jgi:hypothetical protein
MPDQQAAVAFDPAIPRLSAGHFLTDSEVISLAGRTDADARVVIAAADGTERASSYADPDARFGVNVPLREPEERFTVQVTAPSGFVTEEEFQVSVDQAPPPIELESLPPLVTAVEWLSIEGDEAGQYDDTDIDEMRVGVVEAPVARVAGPSRVAVGAPATFDASASSGATGRIRSCNWDFGDGRAAEGPVVEHTYQTPEGTPRQASGLRSRTAGWSRTSGWLRASVMARGALLATTCLQMACASGLWCRLAHGSGGSWAPMRICRFSVTSEISAAGASRRREASRASRSRTSWLSSSSAARGASGSPVACWQPSTDVKSSLPKADPA